MSFPGKSFFGKAFSVRSSVRVEIKSFLETSAVTSTPFSSTFTHTRCDSQEMGPVSRSTTVVLPGVSTTLSAAAKPTYFSVRPRQDRDSFSGRRTYQPKPCAASVPSNRSSFPMEYAHLPNQS